MVEKLNKIQIVRKRYQNKKTSGILLCNIVKDIIDDKLGNELIKFMKMS